MEDIKITCSGDLKLLQDLNTRKATGQDSISAHVLKTYATEIAPVLTFIFQQSLSSGYVPTDWRLANITPIFKKGDKSTPSNYRPVSITPICSKLIEHIIFSNVMDHYENNNVLVDVQHGFRPGRSCETQLLITAQDLSKSLDNKEQVDTVVLDFSKAFDRVPHRRLMLKLQHYGILKWLPAWLDEQLPHQSQPTSGGRWPIIWMGPSSVGGSQGTVLGPLLFLTFINDIPRDISSHLRLFADDCLMYRTISNASDSTNSKKIWIASINGLKPGRCNLTQTNAI